jgi:hypothetical protein
MKKGYILGILFFSSLWGISEAALGGVLYHFAIPRASVYLTIIGFSILTVARVYLPGRGTASAIAALAMLYKFLNSPFFACHILSIFLLGACYDLFFNVLKLKNQSISAALATYAGYSSFALMITYVFRYHHWVEAGLAQVMDHIVIGGTLAALGCAVFVPLSFRLGERLRAKFDMPFRLRLQLASGGVSVVTAGLWAFGIAAYLFS